MLQDQSHGPAPVTWTPRAPRTDFFFEKKKEPSLRDLCLPSPKKKKKTPRKTSFFLKKTSMRDFEKHVGFLRPKFSRLKLFEAVFSKRQEVPKRRKKSRGSHFVFAFQGEEWEEEGSVRFLHVVLHVFLCCLCLLICFFAIVFAYFVLLSLLLHFFLLAPC